MAERRVAAWAAPGCLVLLSLLQAACAGLAPGDLPVVAVAAAGVAAAPAATGKTGGPAPGMQPLPNAALDLPPLAPLPPLPPLPPREFRAAWVATVANIDWPSRPGLTAAAQRAEATAILDRARAIGLNALILQVRPAGDAIYRSALEPWSEYLSGEQGRAPWLAGETAWDPLAWWVDEAHRRGLELHAWFNPYRARHSSARSPLAAPHIGVRNRRVVKPYGDMLWMDPGEPEAAAQTLAVVADVAARYDIDGVHIDDYFYPYPVPLPGAPAPAIPGTPPPDQPFPDDEAWAAYLLADGRLARDDWRRAQVDALVQALYATVHGVKPWLRVGISPFGLGRPDRRPPGISGFSQVDRLYADVERWLQNGWLDYLAPQLYWPIDREGQQFPVLLNYWLAQNTAQRAVWPGLFTSQITRGEALGPRSWPAREVLEQIALVQARAAGAGTGPGANGGGHIHFSMAALMQDRDGIATLLPIGPYAQPALVPEAPWLDAAPRLLPAAPRLHVNGTARDAGRDTGSGTRVLIVPAAGAAAARWAVWRRLPSGWQFDVLPAQARSLKPDGAETVVVRAVDRFGKLGDPALLRLAPPASARVAGQARATGPQ